MVLYKTNKKMIKVDKVTRKLALALSINEEKWNEKQMVKFKERIELKLKKASKAKKALKGVQVLGWTMYNNGRTPICIKR